MTIVVPALRAAVAPAPWVKNELWRNAREVPALDQPFADNKSLIDTISGQQLITHTRASAGTYVGSDKLIKTATTNEARFDHDPVTGESLGLLVEEQRTNYIPYSETILSNVPGGTDRTIVDNAAVAPDGTTTAASVTATGIDPYVVVDTAAGASAGTYTFSIYLKGAAGNSSQDCVLRFQDTGTGLQSSNLFTITTDWRRYSFTAVTTGDLQFVRFDIPQFAVPGDIVYVWGLQIEAGAFPSSYIKNAGTLGGVTRSADVVSIEGANFSSWYRQDEGTVFADAITVSSATSGIIYINNGSVGEAYRVFYNSLTANYAFSVRSGGIEQSSIIGLGGATANTVTKIAASFKVDDLAASRDGGSAVTDTSAVLPAGVDRLQLGATQDGVNLNGTIRRLSYWPQRLPNDTLEAITQ